MVQTLWKTVRRFLIKLKIELPYDPAIPLLEHIPRKDENSNLKRYMHPIVHSSTIYNSQDIEATCPWTDEWVKMGYIYTMEYYSSIKNNKIMPFAATRMDLEIVLLSEVSQTEKDKYHISLICRI